MKKCKGILGFIMGHRFLVSKGGWIYESNYCFRCGIKAGRND